MTVKDPCNDKTIGSFAKDQYSVIFRALLYVSSTGLEPQLNTLVQERNSFCQPEISLLAMGGEVEGVAARSKEHYRSSGVEDY